MKRWKKLQRIAAPFRDSPASVYASAAGYDILVSLLPSAAFVLSLIPYLSVNKDILALWIDQLLPEPFEPMAVYVLTLANQRASAAFLSITALATLWSASKGILAVRDGLDAVLGCEPSRGFLRRRWMGMVSFLIMAGILAALLAAQSLTNDFLFWFFLMALLAIAFRFLPKYELPFSCCLIGGCFSGVGWCLLSRLFSLYVNHFARLQYGSIGLLLLACIWLKLCIILVFYGALLGKLIHTDEFHPIDILKDAFS